MISNTTTPKSELKTHTVVIVGGGAAGISVAASIHKRDPDIDLAIIEPAGKHHYQPGWTMVGGGVFRPEVTCKPMSEVMPSFVSWYQKAVTAVDQNRNQVVLDDGSSIEYEALVLSPGLELNWDGIEGLEAALGSNGVTSNYREGMASYTWEIESQTGHRPVQPAPHAHQVCRCTPEGNVSVRRLLAQARRAGECEHTVS